MSKRIFSILLVTLSATLILTACKDGGKTAAVTMEELRDTDLSRVIMPDTILIEPDYDSQTEEYVFNEKAFGEAFTAATAEHRTWGEIADYYKDICGLRSIWVDQTDYLKCVVPEYERFPFPGRWQLVYDRLFDRVMDNSKILAATGMKQEELMKLYDGLRYEIGRCPADFGENIMKSNYPVNVRMDAYLEARGL